VIAYPGLEQLVTRGGIPRGVPPHTADINRQWTRIDRLYTVFQVHGSRMVLNRVIGSVREEVIGGWRKPCILGASWFTRLKRGGKGPLVKSKYPGKAFERNRNGRETKAGVVYKSSVEIMTWSLQHILCLICTKCFKRTWGRLCLSVRTCTLSSNVLNVLLRYQ
jgi:hypothetical protein